MFHALTRTGLAAAVLVAAPLAARAADLPAQPSYKAPAYVAPAYANWTGFYVGAHAGYGFGNSNWDLPAGTNVRPKGFIGGGTIGYNYQTGVWVWGLEADAGYSAIKGTSDCAPGVTCTTQNDWLGTARLRLGYAGWNNWLPYITGGASFGNIKASTNVLGESSKVKFGYAFGGGLEYAFWSNWSVKAEYIYASLGSFDCGTSCGAPSNEVSFKTSIARAGLNYRF